MGERQGIIRPSDPHLQRSIASKRGALERDGASNSGQLRPSLQFPSMAFYEEDPGELFSVCKPLLACLLRVLWHWFDTLTASLVTTKVFHFAGPSVASPGGTNGDPQPKRSKSEDKKSASSQQPHSKGMSQHVTLFDSVESWATYYYSINAHLAESLRKLALNMVLTCFSKSSVDHFICNALLRGHQLVHMCKSPIFVTVM